MSADSATRETLSDALKLLIFAVIGTAILASVFYLTHNRIAATEEAEKLKLLSQAAPPELYDNNLLKDTVEIPPTPQLGTSDATIAYRGRLRGEPSVVVLEVIAPDGYSGKIDMIVAIRADASIAGVRVVSHKETPGLGDYIDHTKNPWIEAFDGTSSQRYKDTDWQVKKDGGQFDYMAGATITPRAVIKAVHKALQYFEGHRDELFAAKASEGSGK
jgi:electron transport complex protein RnfG